MTQKVRISSKSTHKIDLDDGSFVTIKGSLCYKSLNIFMEAAELLEGKDKKQSVEGEFDLSIKFLKEVIIGWNFIDENGDKIAFDPKLIDEFDIDTIRDIMVPAIALYVPEKKTLQL